MSGKAIMPRCKRCGRQFTPKTEGQEYGPKCAKYYKVEVMGELRLLPSKDDMHKKNPEIIPIYVRGEKGEVAAVIL